MKYPSALTLFGAIGKSLKGGKFYMLAKNTDISEVKRFLVLLAG